MFEEYIKYIQYNSIWHIEFHEVSDRAEQVQKSLEQTLHMSQWIDWPGSVRRNFGFNTSLLHTSTYLNLTTYLNLVLLEEYIEYAQYIERGMACSLYLAQQGALGYLKY